MTDIVKYLDTNRYAIQTLLTIYDSIEAGDEKINIERIGKILGCSKTTVGNRVKEMKNMGLMYRVTLEHHVPFMKVIKLTEKGKELAEYINGIRNLDL